MIFSFVLNSGFLIYIYRMKYASDVEWFRIRAISGGVIVTQLILGALTTYWLFQILKNILDQDEEDARLALENGETPPEEGPAEELIEEVAAEVGDALRRMLQDEEATAEESDAPLGVVAEAELERNRLEKRTTCDIKWLMMNIVLQSLFIAALLLNVISLMVMRLQLVNRIKNYFYYREEPEIAIKY